MTEKKDINVMFDGLNEIFSLTLTRFKTFNEENKDETTKEIVGILSKLTSTITFTVQTFNSLIKSVDYEERLAEIEKKLNIEKMVDWDENRDK